MDAANTALGCSLEVLVQPEGAQEGFFRSPETFTVAIPGQKFSIGMRIVKPAPVAAELVEASLRTPAGWNVRQIPTDAGGKVGVPIQANQPISITFEVEVPQDAAYTQPYWTRAL